MALEVTGKVIQVLAQQTGQGQKGPWVKQAFVIETNDQFPKKLCIQAWNDKTEMVARLHSGDEVKVSLNLESREYQGRWYTDATAWRIEAANDSGTDLEPIAPRGNEEQAPPPADDLPF